MHQPIRLTVHNLAVICQRISVQIGRDVFFHNRLDEIGLPVFVTMLTRTNVLRVYITKWSRETIEMNFGGYLRFLMTNTCLWLSNYQSVLFFWIKGENAFSLFKNHCQITSLLLSNCSHLKWVSQKPVGMNPFQVTIKTASKTETIMRKKLARSNLSEAFMARIT